ncbi:Hypothetical predicted protein [Pelobates cultripes]|uniref:Uncharacterized protein n=1 Tax=Pelobates cultripes TaxID=61616 RepID=A0AAD1VKK1_PELCU|nr:Hypothetical predicted protein [Pelobates cultripes]
MAAAAHGLETDERYTTLEQHLDDLFQTFWRKLKHKADQHKQVQLGGTPPGVDINKAAAPGRMEATLSCTIGGSARTVLTQGHRPNKTTWTIHTAPGTPYMDISTPK